MTSTYLWVRIQEWGIQEPACSVPSDLINLQPSGDQQREQLDQQLGSLSQLLITKRLINELVITTEKHGGQKKIPGSLSSITARSLSDKPRTLSDIQTAGYDYGPIHVSCLSDDQIWTSGNSEIMKLYNLREEILRSVTTKSENGPEDIAMTRRGDLLYSDYNDTSINLVSGTQIHMLIIVRELRPLSFCSTFSGDLLVIME